MQVRCWTRQKLNFFSGTPTTEFLIEDKERFTYYHLTCPPRSLDEFEADELEKLDDRMKGAEVKAVFKPWKVNSGGVLHCVSYEVADVSKELHEVFRLENKALASSSSVATYQHNVDLTNAHNSVLESKEVVKVREELMRVEKEAKQKQLEEEQQKESEAEKQREELGLNILGEKAKKKKEKEEKEKGKETDVENEREKEVERKLLEDRIKKLLYKEVGRRVVLDCLQPYVWREGEGAEWLGELRERVREFVEGNQRSTMKEASFFHSFCNLKNKIKTKKVNEEREAKRKAEADKRKEQGIENEETAAEAEEEDGLIFLPPIDTIKFSPLLDREDNLFSLNVDLTAPTSEPIFSFDDFND